MTDNDQVFAFVAKFFTGARRFPRYFGRFLDGRKVPGGPYKVTQIVIGGIFGLIVVVAYTLHWWSTGMWITDVIFGLAATWGVFWASGKIPQTKRNPVWVALSFLHALTAPGTGTLRGKPVAAKKPHSASSAHAPVHAAAEPAEEPAAEPEPEPEPAAAPAPPALPCPATGVARLLAQTGRQAQN